MLFKNVVDFAVIQEKLIFRPPYWPPFWKKLSKISDNLTRYQVNLNVLKYPIKSFLAITFRFDGFFPYLSPSISEKQMSFYLSSLNSQKNGGNLVIVSFAVILEKLIFRPPYWPPFWKKLSKISDNLTRYQMNLNVPKYPIKSFLAITFRSNPICPRLYIIHFFICNFVG